jgi:hypothetical protein
MAKRGRPKKNPDELLTYSRFSMTLAELEAIEAIADEKNRSVSQIMRALGIAAVANPELLNEALANLDILSCATITEVSI